MISNLAQLPSNAGPWRAIAEFLDAQHLAQLGLRMVPQGGDGTRRDEGTTGGGGALSSAPLGNHGDNTFEVLS